MPCRASLGECYAALPSWLEVGLRGLTELAQGRPTWPYQAFYLPRALPCMSRSCPTPVLRVPPELVRRVPRLVPRVPAELVCRVLYLVPRMPAELAHRVLRLAPRVLAHSAHPACILC